MFKKAHKEPKRTSTKEVWKRVIKGRSKGKGVEWQRPPGSGRSKVRNKKAGVQKRIE